MDYTYTGPELAYSTMFMSMCQDTTLQSRHPVTSLSMGLTREMSLVCMALAIMRAWDSVKWDVIVLRKHDQPMPAKTKFVKQYLIWQSLDSLGNVSKPYICTSTMNSERYLNDCVKKRLIPFINNRDVLFWPDMSTCHYSESVVNYLKSKNIDFIEKHNNAPKVPQARPIEKFWAICKREYRSRKHPAKNLNSFRRI